MQHLTQAELNDYARGLRRDTHPHLAECAECGHLLSFLRKVTEAACSIEVPEPVVEAAKAIFPGAKDFRQEQSFKQRLAKLVFLQTAGQQVADLRSIQQSARQAIYRHGDYSIDLRAEEEPDSIRTSLVGQIVNQRDPQSAVSGVPVTLLLGKRTLQEHTCNGLGEFMFDFVSNARLCLRFDLANEGYSIEVPLKDLSDEDS